MLSQYTRWFSKYIPLILAALLSLQIAAFAQGDTGSLSGIIKDPNGAIVPGATITVKNERTGEERTATANEEGHFSIPALKASSYTVTATTTGQGGHGQEYRSQRGRETSVTIPLQLADLTAAAVNIVAGEEVISSTGSAGMGANVNPREVAGLPLNGRQLFAALSTGAGFQ